MSGDVTFQDSIDNDKAIFAFLGSRNIGDFAQQVIVATAVKHSLKDYRLAVFYTDDRPYKADILSLTDNVDFILEGKPNQRLAIDIFDVYSGGRLLDHEGALEFELSRSSIILAGNGLRTMCLPGFPAVPRLRVPEETAEAHEAKLRDLGLDPDRWFACVYWREPGYLGRTPHAFRDIVDPEPYLQTISYIVEELGGQVVRLGHPTKTKLPDLPGIIDLAKVEDSLMTQITAVSRARFFVSSCSGPLSFGPGFGTPTAVTDNIDFSGVWNDHDILLTQRITAPDGKLYHQKDSLKKGFLESGRAKLLLQAEKDLGYRYHKNTASDLKYVTQVLFDRTGDCPAWRGEEPDPAPTPEFTIKLPLLAAVKRSTLIDIPT